MDKITYTNEELVRKMIANAREMGACPEGAEMSYMAGYLESFLINQLYQNEDLLAAVIDNVDWQNQRIEAARKVAA